MMLHDEVRITGQPGAPAPTEEVFTRCRQFVVDTALQLEADDYEFDAWSPQRAAFDARGTMPSVAVRVIPRDD